MQVFYKVFSDQEPLPTPQNWPEAFHRLNDAINRCPKDKRIILFFDELPWLCNKKSGFLEALTYLWNQYLDSDSRIILITCGSAATWMIKNVIDSKGGLYNRVTGKIHLLPFNLLETKEYLAGNAIRLNSKQIVEIYMAIGGVAAYLRLVKPGKSSAQVISEVCFSSLSPISGEFERIFKSLFSKSDLHIKAIKALARKRSGLERSQLFKEIKITSGSVQNRLLRELIESGFATEYTQFGKTKKNSHICLTDEYSAFYLKWNREIKKRIILLSFGQRLIASFKR